MHLTKYEQETIVNWNRGEKMASIYTFEKALQRRLQNFADHFPGECRLKTSTEEGSKTYEINKSCLSLRLNTPFSEECRKAFSERAKLQGLHELAKRENVNGSKS